MNQISTSNRAAVSILVAWVLAMAAASSLAAQTVASSSAFGESATVNVLPLLGSGILVQSGPLPQVSGSAGPAYSRNGSVLSASLSTPITGEILRTGVLNVSASSQMPAAVLTRGTAVVNDTAITLGHLIPLLSIHAGVIQSAATIDGTCGSSLTANGSADLAGVTLGGILGLGLSVPPSPSPNTVLLNVAGVRIVLNEQAQTGDGIRTQEMAVNAVHIYLDNTLLSGLGLISGDIVIAGSQASVQCPANPNPNPNPNPPSANLSLTGSDSPDPVAPGGQVTYSFTVTNQGPDPATQVVFSNTPPAGLGSVSTSASQGSCSSGTPAICTLGTLAPSQSATVTVMGTVNAISGVLTDTATVTSGVADPDSSGNAVTLTTQVSGGGGPVERQADLALSATAEPASVQVGQTSRLTFTLVNRGPDTASEVMLAGLLDPRADLQSFNASQGSCSTNGPLSCNLGTLGAGQQVMVTLVMMLQGRDTMHFEGVGSSAVADPDLSNNAASIDITVLASTTNPPIDPGACRIDMMPAATLLFPYFEVDLDRPNGATTLISINNASPEPKLAQVTFWSDWGVPTLSFTLSLSGHDVQTLNLRDVLGNGSLPPAARAPGCGASAALTKTTMDHLQAWHCGLKSPVQGNCAAPARTGHMATGYITVDAVNHCTSSNPTEPGYFVAGGRGIASDDNVLWGDFFLVNSDQFQAHGDPAVHILALPNTFLGRYSFYGSFVGGSGIDDRQPLGTRYATRYVSGGLFDGGTQLVIWRDAKVARPTGVVCGQEPQRLELAGMVRDEDGRATVIPSSKLLAPWSTQRVILGRDNFTLPYAFGWLNLDLWHKGGTLFGDTAQGWVTTVMSAHQRFSIGARALRMDSACDF